MIGGVISEEFRSEPFSYVLRESRLFQGDWELVSWWTLPDKGRYFSTYLTERAIVEGGEPLRKVMLDINQRGLHRDVVRHYGWV